MSTFEIIVAVFLLITIFGIYKMIDQITALHKQVAELSHRIAPYDMPEEIFQKAQDFNINDIGRLLGHIQSDLNRIEMYISNKEES